MSMSTINYVFKIAQKSQADEIFSLYQKARIEGNRNGSSDWSTEYPLREDVDIDIEKERLFIYLVDNKVIASITLLETDDLDNEPLQWKRVKSCVPVKLCVDPAYQGQHIGERLMNELKDYVRKKGYKSIRLLASTRNKAANRLYQRMEFECLGTVYLYGTEFYAYELLL